MSVEVNVKTPGDSGRAVDLAPPGGVQLPPGSENLQVLTWNADRSAPEWRRFTDLFPDLPLPGKPPAEVLPEVGISDTTVVEPTIGNTTVASFLISLNKASTQAVQVEWKTISSTAREGIDFTAGSGTVIFTPGETQRAITVIVRGDNTEEGAEEFGVLLSKAIGATLGKTLGICKIIEVVTPPPVDPPPNNIGKYFINRLGDRLVLRSGDPMVAR